MKSLLLAQSLELKPVYRVEEIIQIDTISRATGYRMLKELEQLGLVERIKRGYYSVRTCVKQPANVLEHLIPTLQALKQARTFGKYYNESDARVAKNIINGLITLDYKAYELTHYQSPSKLFIYVDNLDNASTVLKNYGFSEGTKGSVVLLPRIGDFSNEIQRVYLDCIAYGGRSTYDAIAIELLYGDKLKTKGVFPVELISKVKEDMPRVPTIESNR